MRNSVAAFLFLFLFLFSFLCFSGCSLPENERAKIITVIELRENALNSGDVQSYRAMLSDSFKDLGKHMEQVKLRNQYLSGFVYTFTSTQVSEVSNFGKKVIISVEFDLTYKRPDDPGPYVWLNSLEFITFVKDEIGWRISNIEDRENSGMIIKPIVTQAVFHALDTRIAALNNGDSDLFETIVATDYPQRKEIISNFAANSEVFSDINYEVHNRKFLFIAPTMDEARLEQIYSLSFKIKGTEDFERFKNQKEIISLKRDWSNGNWVITDGLK